jgi:hypothetical protein
MKTNKLYAVRFYPNGGTFSRHVGYKMRLLDRARAGRAVKRLKRLGVAAFAAPVAVRASAPPAAPTLEQRTRALLEVRS